MTLTATRTATVREATPADLATIVAMALTFNRSTEYAAHIVFHPDRVRETAVALMEAERGLLLVVEQGGDVIGMLAAAVTLHPLSGDLVANEIAWWIEEAARGSRAALQLLRRYEQWAREQGATVIQMAAPDVRTGRFYVRLGFAPVETLYQRRMAT